MMIVIVVVSAAERLMEDVQIRSRKVVVSDMERERFKGHPIDIWSVKEKD